MTDVREILSTASQLAIKYREGETQNCPYEKSSAQELEALFDVGLPQEGRPGTEVITQLADAAGSGLLGVTGDAFFGWVMGSSHPVGVAADWLATAWGQNAAIYQTSPAAAVAEGVAVKWLLDLLDLPRQSSIGLTTGATMASFICLAAARSEVLKRAGFDLERDGMFGVPEVSVFVSQEAHSSIFSTLRCLGFGSARLMLIEADKQGRMIAQNLAEKLGEREGPKIIICQAGHINSGAFDDFNAISELAASFGAWLHVDGAFGLWARAAPDYRQLCDGVEKADSWAVDGHKWLQVPYESGYAIVKHPEVHKRAMTISASYLNESPKDGRNPSQFVPELSRRARGFATWAVLQALGRDGVTALVNDNCRAAQQLSERLSGVAGINVLNEVCLNQVVISFGSKNLPTNDDELTLAVVRRLQDEGRWFVKEAEWFERKIVRVSFSSGSGGDLDVSIFASAITTAWECVMREFQPVLNETHQ